MNGSHSHQNDDPFPHAHRDSPGSTNHTVFQEWLASDGVALIDRMAYQEGWRSRLHDGLMWAAAHVYGTYLRWRAKRE